MLYNGEGVIRNKDEEASFFKMMVDKGDHKFDECLWMHFRKKMKIN